MLRTLFLLTVSLFLTTGCAPKQPAVPKISVSLEGFVCQAPPPLTDSQRKRLYIDFLAHRYAPWLTDELNATGSEATWAVDFFKKRSLYGENRLPLPKKRLNGWITNANYSAFNTLKRHAIVIHPTSLRLLPTHRPVFFDPTQPGEGYPFDYNQNSTVKAMTPIIVSHESLDGGWLFVQTPFALGWLPLRDVAYVSQSEIDRIMALANVVLLKEETPIYDANQSYLFRAKMATLFPSSGTESSLYAILVPKKEGTSLRLELSMLPKAFSAPMPLRMDKAEIRRVAEELLGEPYGWGGMAEDRDCSAMTRDFFAPFGIWLPRNSKQQARVGKVIDLSNHSTASKERVIVEKGVPFRTLLYLPGHIMLYVGHKNGRAYVMHNLWGIRTKGNGRYIIGRAVVTDLYLGKNLLNADTGALLIKRIVSMNIVGQ
ncbi:SH3 domain-containing C40 family peptidase [Hydrogenimonas urashimensis]|uniref:SH3 domain-containing C40 family peptidase n=1 Tax=Hydrogenimonas urashimensis TaxID=2740515 RepID=UPI0019166957|nr:SH3 domain-containing C40 family peptidase [Hydrogenimonas urashimensis]